MPTRVLVGAMCVQRFDDSLNSAIHITYRISLRSSSMPEPRDPLLKGFIYFCLILRNSCKFKNIGLRRPVRTAEATGMFTKVREFTLYNDPSAGSPTETLLRLLLPLNDRVWRTFRPWVVVAHLPGPVRTPH